MNTLTRTIGLVVLVLGLFGLIAGVAGVVGAWVLASQVKAVNRQVFARVDSAVAVVDDKARQAGNVVQDVRDSVGTLKQAVEQPGATRDLLDAGRRLASALERATDWLRLAATAAELIEHLTAAVDAATAGLEDESGSAVQLLREIRAAQESLAEASRCVEDIQRHLARIRDDDATPETTSKIAALAGKVDERLAVVQGRLAEFGNDLADTRVRLNDTEGRIRGWVSLGAIVVTCLLAWIGAGQLSLLMHGWAALRSKKQP